MMMDDEDYFSSSSSSSSTLIEEHSHSTSMETMQDDGDSMLVQQYHETEIAIPGFFVVLQGNEGDGMSNTINSMPTLPNNSSNRNWTAATSSRSSRITTNGTIPTRLQPTNENNNNDHGTAVSMSSTTAVPTRSNSNAQDGPPPPPAVVSPPPGPPPPSASSTQLLGRLAISTAHNPYAGRRGVVGTVVTSSSSSSVVSDTDHHHQSPVMYNNNNNNNNSSFILSPADAAAIQEWKLQCWRTEQQQRQEWKESLAQVPSSQRMLDHCMMAERSTWWLVQDTPQSNNNHQNNHNQLAILRDIPIKLRNGNVLRTVIGSLSPGSTVLARDIVHLDSQTLQRIPVLPISQQQQQTQNSNSNTMTTNTTTNIVDNGSCYVYAPGHKGIIQMIQVETKEGRTGYAVLSLDGYPLCGPGLPSWYLDPTVWIWRVTCPVGAYVRKGLGLNSPQIDTLPYGSLIRVSRRCINDQGLSRLRTRGTVTVPSTLQQRRVDGWCSELLNPLSGQRGIIAQPLPFPVPAIYRVTLPIGAVIRQNIELSSPQIGIVPYGSVVKVVARAFSEHPVDKCIERLQLAGNAGWISVRLNRSPPHDDMVVELVDVDGEFDPEEPGIYHLQTQRAARSRRQQQQQSSNERSIADLSSVDENDVSESSDEDMGSSAVTGQMRNDSNASPNNSDLRCVVCLTSERNATIVHGETGHVVCCLVCARILKARGDNCPVCRLNIDVVIQHFYA